MENITKLNILDFSPGIKATPINENFQLIKRWIEQERLRVSGYGIVEGFKMSDGLAEEEFTITVGDGVLINAKGEELVVPGETFDGFEMDPEYGLKPRPETAIEVLKAEAYGNYSRITLQNKIFTEDWKTNNGIFKDRILNGYNGNMELPTDLIIENDDSQVKIPRSKIVEINGAEIILSKEYVGNNIKVTYKYAGSDRFDGIFIRKDASPYDNNSMFRYCKGLGSMTPTCEEDEYIIAYVYWHVENTIEVEFLTSDRSYRQVYVDENGQLWLMGKPFDTKKEIIYAHQATNSDNEKLGYPEGYPTVDDFTLWYDKDDNILKVWRKDNSTGKYGWYPVNDLSRFNRDSFQYPGVIGQDTFVFDLTDPAQTQLQFVPGKNQLTIIIDQIVIMNDQYRELYDPEGDLNQAIGYGFELIEPLDNDCIVEVRVDHNANNQNCEEDLFKKVSCFIDENTFNASSSKKAYSIKDLSGAQFELNKYQLEVWHNGVKLELDTDFSEAFYKNGQLTAATSTSSTEVDGWGEGFILNKNITSGLLTYRITRFMGTYANFKSVINPVRDRVETLENSSTVLSEDTKNIWNKIGNSSTQNSADKSIFQNLDELYTKVNDLDSKTRKTSVKIKQTDLDNELKNKILHKKSLQKVSAYNDSYIDAKKSDLIFVTYVKDRERVPLIQNLDYTLENDDDGLLLRPMDMWIDKDANLYVQIVTASEA